mmetsp:Transcript_18017/g.20788  ORF Transcript_18017/g.20788 Transcript_18017/m.20788 type:complete len:99 (-) Transcript_18017:7-303(-)
MAENHRRHQERLDEYEQKNVDTNRNDDDFEQRRYLIPHCSGGGGGTTGDSHARWGYNYTCCLLMSQDELEAAWPFHGSVASCDGLSSDDDGSGGGSGS